MTAITRRLLLSDAAALTVTFASPRGGQASIRTVSADSVDAYPRPGQDRMTASPYGFWTSPITSDLVVADSIRFEQVALDGDVLYWSETRPQKKGRSLICRM